MANRSRKEQNSLDEKQQVRDFLDAPKGGIFVEVGAHEATNIESQSWHLE